MRCRYSQEVRDCRIHAIPLADQVQGIKHPGSWAIKALEDENRRQKKLVAEKELIIQTMDEILKKSFKPRPETAAGPTYTYKRGLKWLIIYESVILRYTENSSDTRQNSEPVRNRPINAWLG